MDSVENYIFTGINDILGGIRCGQADANEEMKFPYVKIEMNDMYEDSRGIDSGGKINFVHVTFTVSAYSDVSKQETKKIISKVTDYMKKKNLRCTSTAPMQVGSKAEIYRRVATYEGTYGALEGAEGFYR